MHFSDIASANNSKSTKIATVVAIHVILGYGLIQSMSTIRITPEQPAGPVILIDVPKPPPKEVEPEPVKKTVAKLNVPIVPPPEVRIQTDVEPPITVVEKVDPNPQPSGPAVLEGPVSVEPVVKSAGIRTAVFAEGCAVPEYPSSSLRNGEEGTVVLALMVNAAGKVDNARVTKSSGHRNLDRAAQNALSLCKFQPAMDNGQPQAGWAQISYNWKLDN
jgi:protein TonB